MPWTDDDYKLAKSFWEHMCYEYGARTIQPDDSRLRGLAADFLSLMGIVDHDDFLERFSITLHRDIHPCFVPGSKGISPWGQVRICTHEIQHVHQSVSRNPVVFGPEYALDLEKRAQAEAEAYRSGWELSHWAGEKLPEPDVIRGPLASYGLRRRDIDFVVQYIDSSIPTIEHGGIICDAAQTAIAWLEEHASHWKVNQAVLPA